MNNWLLIALITINIVLFLYSSSSMQARAMLFSKYAVIPNAIRRGEWYRLITSAFFHNDIFHIFLNMYSLFVLYPSVIIVMSGLVPAQFVLVSFLSLYFFSAIIAGLLSAGRRDSIMPSIGASGAIFGLLGFLLTFGLLTFGNGGAALVQSILFVLLINFAVGLMPGLNIDNRGHLGGLVGGILFGLAAFLLVIFAL